MCVCVCVYIYIYIYLSKGKRGGKKVCLEPTPPIANQQQISSKVVNQVCTVSPVSLLTALLLVHLLSPLTTWSTSKLSRDRQFHVYETLSY